MKPIRNDLISVWKATAEPIEFPQLGKDIDVDAVVVGGGITGVTAAHLLAEAGLEVALLEAWSIGEGATGYSTGNLYVPVDERLQEVKSKFDEKTVRQVAESRQWALEHIATTVSNYGLECDFHRQAWHLFSEAEERDAEIEKEYAAARLAGLDASMPDSLPLPFPIRKVLRIENQAQFNPLQYTKTYARSIAGKNCRIFENSAVSDIQKGSPNVLKTTDGITIRAKFVVLATHTPKGVESVQNLLGAYREYGIALKLKDDSYPPGGIFWGQEAQGHHHSFRTFEHQGELFLVVVGDPYRVGQRRHTEQGFGHLAAYASRRFRIDRMVYRWAAQHYRPADALPYIGPETEGSTVYFGTGYATDGLIYGTLAARIIADQIAGRENPWAKLYDPGRHTLLESAGQAVKQAANVASQYARDLPMPGPAPRLDILEPGQGRVIEEGGEKLAVCRDASGTLHTVSAVCTHMGCVVNWNSAESTWDCPCHGSRFTPDGEVIEGPALAALASRAQPARGRSAQS